jgi:TonB family protein
MKLTPDQQAGLYITVSIHLAVIIVLLAARIGMEVQRENSFVLDFTAQEAAEKLQEHIRLQKSVEAQLEQMIQDQGGVPLRNVTVDRSSLKDDRGTNAEELYKEAERLAKELQEGQSRADELQDSFAAMQEEKKEKKKEEARPYSGPSVLSWSLDGRKASRLPIPAYRCYGGGEITVIITVNNRGDVLNAKVDESVSSKDHCLQEFAIRAARLSKFSASTQAPARQMGTITYAFIAQ